MTNMITSNTNTSNRWHLKVYMPYNSTTLHEGDYPTIKAAALSCGLESHQLWELTDRGRRKRKGARSKFHPVIECNKIDR